MWVMAVNPVGVMAKVPLDVFIAVPCPLPFLTRMKASEVSVDGIARPAKGTGSAAAGNVAPAKNSTTTEDIRKRIVMFPPGGGDGYNGQGNEPPRGSFPSRDRNRGDGVPKEP